MGEGSDQRSIEVRPRSALDPARSVALARRVARDLGEANRRVGVHTRPFLVERVLEVLASHRPDLDVVVLHSPAACRAALLAGDLHLLLSDKSEAFEAAARTSTPYVSVWLGEYAPLYTIADTFGPVYRSTFPAGMQQAVWAEPDERDRWLADTVEHVMALGVRSKPMPGARRVLRLDRGRRVVSYGASGVPDPTAEPQAEETRLDETPLDQLDAIVCCFCGQEGRDGASSSSVAWGDVRGRVPVLVKACCVQFEAWLNEGMWDCPAEAAASVQGMLLGDLRGPEDHWSAPFQRSFVLRDVMRETP